MDEIDLKTTIQRGTNNKPPRRVITDITEYLNPNEIYDLITGKAWDYGVDIKK